MTCRIFTAVLFLPLAAFAQEDSVGLRVGVRLTTVFSALNENGVTPALTVRFRRHCLSLGPRIVYSDLFAMEKKPANAQSREYVLDGAYRYYPFQARSRKIMPFAQLSVEYSAGDHSYTQNYYDYTGQPQSSYGPVFDHDFEGRYEGKNRNVTVQLGPGVDIPVWRGLYCTVAAGLGLGYYRSEEAITNNADGQTEYARTIAWRSGGLQWMAAAGAGYRF